MGQSCLGNQRSDSQKLPQRPLQVEKQWARETKSQHSSFSKSKLLRPTRTSCQLHIYKVLVIIKEPSHLYLFEDLSSTVDLTDNGKQTCEVTIIDAVPHSRVHISRWITFCCFKLKVQLYNIQHSTSVINDSKFRNKNMEIFYNSLRTIFNISLITGITFTNQLPKVRLPM